MMIIFFYILCLQLKTPPLNRKVTFYQNNISTLIILFSSKFLRNNFVNVAVGLRLITLETNVKKKQFVGDLYVSLISVRD